MSSKSWRPKPKFFRLRALGISPTCRSATMAGGGFRALLGAHPYEANQIRLAASAGVISARLPMQRQQAPRHRAAGAWLSWTRRQAKQGGRRIGDGYARPRWAR